MRGLPGRLPAGERVLWQGAPDWRAMTRRVFHIRALAAYFGVLLAYAAVHAVSQGKPALDVLITTAKFGGLALVPLALLTLYAWGTARATVYTITNRRVAIRMGLALPMTMNLPFAQIDAAGFSPARDGTGDIALRLASGGLGYVILWPHARPWHLAKAEPMLRAVPHAARVAQILSRALATAAALPVPQLQDAASPASIVPTRPQTAAA